MIQADVKNGVAIVVTGGAWEGRTGRIVRWLGRDMVDVELDALGRRKARRADVYVGDIDLDPNPEALRW